MIDKSKIFCYYYLQYKEEFNMLAARDENFTPRFAKILLKKRDLIEKENMDAVALKDLVKEETKFINSFEDK